MSSPRSSSPDGSRYQPAKNGNGEEASNWASNENAFQSRTRRRDTTIVQPQTGTNLSSSRIGTAARAARPSDASLLSLLNIHNLIYLCSVVSTRHDDRVESSHSWPLSTTNKSFTLQNNCSVLYVCAGISICPTKLVLSHDSCGTTSSSTALHFFFPLVP